MDLAILSALKVGGPSKNLWGNQKNKKKQFFLHRGGTGLAILSALKGDEPSKNLWRNQKN